jgi:hypothetical protein
VTHAGDKIVSIRRPFGHLLSTAVRDLSSFPRLARALGIVPAPPPAKLPSVHQDLGEHPPRS